MCGSTVGSGGGQELAVTYDLACLSGFCCRESAYGAVDRLLDGTVCPVCIGVAAWGLLRSRFDCRQPFGGEGEKYFCCSYYDYGDDGCQFVRCPGWNFLGHFLSWRLVFVIAALWGGVTIWFIRRWVPVLPALPATNLKGQFRFLRRSEPWMLIAATMLGNGGGFCWYSYVNPLMTDVSGFSIGAMPVLMLLAGASMCIGNYLGGHLSDRFTPGIVAMSMQFLMFASLLLIYFFASYGFLSALLMCVCTGCLFAVSSPQQLLLLQYSPGGEMMGGAMVQLAFNLGNAVGAYFGGLSIEHGAGLESTALIGSFFALLGTTVFLVFNYMVLKPQWKLL